MDFRIELKNPFIQGQCLVIAIIRYPHEEITKSEKLFLPALPLSYTPEWRRRRDSNPLRVLNMDVNLSRHLSLWRKGVDLNHQFRPKMADVLITLPEQKYDLAKFEKMFVYHLGRILRSVRESNPHRFSLIKCNPFMASRIIGGVNGNRTQLKCIASAFRPLGTCHPMILISFKC